MQGVLVIFPRASQGIVVLNPVELPFVNAIVIMVKQKSPKSPPQQSGNDAVSVS